VLTNLKIVLPIFGCDPALFKPSQPCRLPGARRDDRWQKLIWFEATTTNAGGQHHAK
jgi:hypothetical protein